jgi:mannose-1-phosphate guanylyltransferase
VEEISRKFTVGIYTNHYVWRPKECFESLQKIRPDWFDLIEELMKYLDTDKEKEKLEEIYKKFEPDRIEVLTTELIKENKLLAVELPFDWTHITTWDDVYRYRENKKMPLDNGKVVNVESEGNMVMASDKKVVAMVGMKDMVVVDTDDALLIMPRSMASKIKEAGDILEEKGFKDYL